MSSYVSEDLRRLVAIRADFLCEYCLIHEDDTFYGCQVDHILNGFTIEPLTDIGEVTARILGFNTIERLLERETLVMMHSYPAPAALVRMT
jgi:hypothetical protein